MSLSVSVSLVVHTLWVFRGLMYSNEVGMSKNNALLKFGFLFGLINGIIDDKLYVPR